MAFVRFDLDYIKKSYTLVDNQFINEFLPSAPDDAIRVYLYGLYLCNNAVENMNNSIDNFINALNLTQENIEKSFQYWQDKGLISIVQESPLEVKYLPISKSRARKKFKIDKYSDFNSQLQDLFPNRMITPNEYSEYYYLIESTKITPEAMLMIAKYCIDYKGDNIRYPYILTVARNWANEGVLTVEAVEARLRDLESNSEDMLELFSALGKKGTPTLTDMQEYTKWTKSWGFSKETILYTASQFKNRGTIAKLDKLLDEYFRMDIFDLKDIREYIEHRELLYDVSIAVNKSLGLYYESLDNVVETYIAPWISKGYDKETLILIADYCFKGSIRRLEGMNEVINKFYKLGLISQESINNYISMLIINDNRIRKIFEVADIHKSITTSDRNYYKTWIEDWGFEDSVILYCASLSKERARAFTYINKILSNWKSQGIITLEQAKKASKNFEIKENTKPLTQRNYTSEEINALFDDIDDLKEIN